MLSGLLVEPEPPQALRIRLFGALEIDDGSRVLGPRDLGGARPKQVLEILLAGRGHLVPTDRLAERLWGEKLPLKAGGSLQTFVSVLRRHLSPDRDRARELVVTEAEAYRFATDLVELDLDRFDELVERSAREPTGEARRSLEQALALVRGEVLGLAPTAETRALEAAVLREEDVRSLLPRPIVRARRTGGARAVRLLGREGELDTLERAAREALEDSFALLFVEGEAGVGKTRLLDELATSLAGTRIGRWSCAELEQHLPYVPLAGALRDALDGVELDPRRRPALARILPELVLEQGREFADVEALEALAEVIAEQEPLAQLLGADAAELTEELERLCERRILRVDGLRFRFRYQLVHQVLLNSLSPARRRLLRGRLGAASSVGG